MLPARLAESPRPLGRAGEEPRNGLSTTRCSRGPASGAPVGPRRCLRPAGPEPADEVLRKLDQLQPDRLQPRLCAQPCARPADARPLLEAWPLALEASEGLREFTGDNGGEHVAEIATFAGDFDTAAAYLRVQLPCPRRRSTVSTISRPTPLMLGRSLCALGRYSEAEPLAKQGRELGHEQDLVTPLAPGAGRGPSPDAVSTPTQRRSPARQSLSSSGQTGSTSRATPIATSPRSLSAGGRSGEAAAVLTQALDRYERKRNLLWFPECVFSWGVWRPSHQVPRVPSPPGCSAHPNSRATTFICTRARVSPRPQSPRSDA